MNRPWMKFYPRDWRTDPGLRSVGLSARGLWIELMAVMHDCSEYGVLSINGRAPTVAQISAMVGATDGEVDACLGELEAAGVFSRSEGGLILSRRMVRDEELAQVRAQSGAAGLANRWQTPSKPIASPRARASAPARTRADSDSDSDSCVSLDGEIQEGAPVEADPVAPDPPKPKRPRKPATGPQADCVRHWESEWARTRLGAVWKWTARHASDVAKALDLAGGDVSEFRLRATRLLESGDDWTAANASPALLVSRWNQLGVVVVPRGSMSNVDRAIADYERMGGTFQGEAFGDAATRRIGESA